MMQLYTVILLAIQIWTLKGQETARILWQCVERECQKCRTDLGGCDATLPAYSLVRNCRYDCNEETTTKALIKQRQSNSHVRYFCSPNKQCQSCDPTIGNCPTAALYDTETDCEFFCKPDGPVPVAAQYYCNRAQCYECGSNGRSCPDGASLHDTMEICRLTCRQDTTEFFQCISGQCYGCRAELGNCVQDVARFTSNDECSNRCTNAPEVRWYCNENGCSDCIGRACPQQNYGTENQCQLSGCSRPKCGKNEIFKLCRGCDRTCKTRYGKLSCSERCAPGCACSDGYVRSTRYGKPCVATRQCEERAQVSYCNDKHTRCKHWAERGECDENPTWMKAQCRKSCNKCRRVVFILQRALPSPTSDCSDSDEKCPEWASKGECRKNSIWMTQNCRMSCRTCRNLKKQRRRNITSQCRNKHRRCQEWAGRGECNANSIWMLKNCEKSCKVCRSSADAREERFFNSNASNCRDYEKDCSKWAKKGECTANPSWMRRNCRRSCNACN